MKKTSFSVSTTGHGNSKDCKELINKLNELIELRYDSDIKLNVKEVGKHGIRMEIGNSGYKLAGFDHFKSEILEESKRIENKDLEDMVYRKEITLDEIVNFL